MREKIVKAFGLDARWYVALALAWIHALHAKSYGITALGQVISICFIACALDFLIVYAIGRRVAFPLSALVSGLIISGIQEPSRLFYVAPLAAIFSKHIIKVSGRHIFNPAAFGLLASNVLFGLPLSWWIEAHRAIIIIFGLFIVYRIRKISLICSFISIGFILSFGYSLIQRQAPLSSAGLISFFFVFFMLPEPKTSPAYLKAKLIYGAAVSLLVILWMAVLPRYDFMILGLITGNIAGLFLRKVR